MKLDRVTLVTLIAIEAARLHLCRPALIDSLTLVVWLRLFATLHPRRLAVTVRADRVDGSRSAAAA
jgi:hypothetical protein